MATDQAVKESQDTLPEVDDLEEMPRPKRGRQGIDTTPFEKLIGDFKPHALKNIKDKNSKERWARKLRLAADRMGLEVETTYVPTENTLAFKGYPIGEAPARGRRTEGRDGSSDTPKKSNARATNSRSKRK